MRKICQLYFAIYARKMSIPKNSSENIKNHTILVKEIQQIRWTDNLGYCNTAITKNWWILTIFCCMERKQPCLLFKFLTKTPTKMCHPQIRQLYFLPCFISYVLYHIYSWKSLSVDKRNLTFWMHFGT